MDEIRLKNFRCFREPQRARLAPLTLLVGENSTGKTSFLALIRALWDVAHRRAPSFKEAPYDLGSFDEIAHYWKGRPGRTTGFEAGFDGALPPQGAPAGATDLRRYSFDVVFSRSGTVPVPAKWKLRSDDAWIEQRVENGSSRRIHFGTTNGSWRREMPPSLPEGLPSEIEQVVSLTWYMLAAHRSSDISPLNDSPPMTEKDDEQLRKLAVLPIVSVAHRPFANAPVRSKPLRTYDPSDPSSEPEGANVPMYLSTAFFDDKKGWDGLKKALEEFGHDAGLFDEISVKPLGKRGSEPFQVHVRKYGRRAKGPMRNLIDVGYGVSQVLPVITELFRERERPMFLLQQPEVHLHPSAQAALGSLFCRIAAPHRQLVVETHSDHLIDRVRMDVRDSKAGLKPEEVSILYFERRGLDVQIHSLRVDEQGNVLNAPRSYRRFFLDETRRSLGL